MRVESDKKNYLFVSQSTGGAGSLPDKTTPLNPMLSATSNILSTSLKIQY